MRSNAHTIIEGVRSRKLLLFNKINVADAPNKNSNIDVRDKISVHNTSRLVMQHAKVREKYRLKQLLSWITQVSVGSNKFSSISQSSYRVSQSHFFFHAVF
jgi:hypothetical protein